MNKIITAIIILAVLGGLAAGVLWVIKSLSEQGSAYFEVVQDARQTAWDLKCLEQLRVLGADIQMYEAASGRLPGDLAELGRRDLLRCPAPNGQPYEYIAGQNPTMRGANILVYEPQAAHDGKHAVLRLDGQVELLTSQQLQEELEKTRFALSR
jgi:hypothetical protein